MSARSPLLSIPLSLRVALLWYEDVFFFMVILCRCCNPSVFVSRLFVHSCFFSAFMIMSFLQAFNPSCFRLLGSFIMRSPVPWRLWWSPPSLMHHFYTHTRSGKFPPQEIRALQLQSGTRLDILFLSTPPKTAIFTSFEKYLSKQLAVKSQESSLLIVARCLNKSHCCNMYR